MPKEKLVKWTEADIERIRLHFANGGDRETIAKRYGITEKTVSRYCKEYGIEIIMRVNRIKQKAYWTPEEIEQVKEWAKAGKTGAFIGQQFGISKAAAIARCSRLGIPLTAKRGYSGGHGGKRTVASREHRAEPVTAPSGASMDQQSALEPLGTDEIPGNRQCRHITGVVPNHRYCSRETWNVTAYCEYHYNKMYVRYDKKKITGEVSKTFVSKINKQFAQV